MADKRDYSEIIAEMLIELGKHSTLLDKHGRALDNILLVQEKMLDTQDQMQQTQERIADRLDRSDAGFNHFAGAVLDHLGAIRSDLRDVRTTVFQDHEDRLRRLEDFMRRAS
ncbi:hypothetical protein CDA63_04220 [Hymenobacter amundsenii]|uniref:Uncharacterized protein n=1 Tax=Hymenobacter amundsenii TaxID=2006685 RepID=A0A246FNC3_9BACT|nr:hypothetical protein [Hymenobacter amundsenii]OWP64251.1 hypothetical protein CDA63_04220 [Hymenobacter amundsenii]